MQIRIYLSFVVVYIRVSWYKINVQAVWERLLEKIGMKKKLEQYQQNANSCGNAYQLVQDHVCSDSYDMLRKREQIFRRGL